METLASVTDVDIEEWWNLTQKAAFESIKRLRNNLIRTLGDAPVEGNFVVMSLCCSLRLHILFSNTRFPSPPQQKIY
jgi:transcriptional accessory protein Tex/SPT6